MASLREHIDQAKHNEEIADVLLNPVCASNQWVIVISFYSALQYIEAAFTNTAIGHLDEYYGELVKNSKKRIPSKHTVMEDLILNNVNMSAFYEDYRTLRISSEAARYLRTGYKMYFKESFARDCFEKRLVNIKTHLEQRRLIDLSRAPTRSQQQNN